MCENCQQQSCKAFIRLSILFYAKIWRIMTDPLQNADFQSSFAHNASAITPSEKVQLTLIVSPLRALNEPQMNSIR